MNKANVKVSQGDFQRIQLMQYSVVRIKCGTPVAVGDSILIESVAQNEIMGSRAVLVREIVDFSSPYCIDGDPMYFEAFIRNNNYKL